MSSTFDVVGEPHEGAVLLLAGKTLPVFTISTDLCADVIVRLAAVAIEVLGPNAPRDNRTGGTCSLAERVLGLFTFNEPRDSGVDAMLDMVTLHPTTPRPLGHALVGGLRDSSVCMYSSVCVCDG